jgi:hypothetical protein
LAKKKLVESTLYSLSAIAPECPDRRSDERYVSLLRVGALTLGGRRELCLIRNVSAGGMMIRPYSPIAAGTHLTVELKQGDSVSGVVQWSDKGLVGITFDEPIDVLALLNAPGGRPRPRMPRIELSCAAATASGCSPASPASSSRLARGPRPRRRNPRPAASPTRHCAA